MPGPEPPSPIDLLPRFEPPSPIDLRPRSSPLSPFHLRPCSNADPPSPISLLPRHEPLSPLGASSLLQQPVGMPPPRPFASLGRTTSAGSPVLSLAPRQAPASPGNGTLHGGGAAGGSPRGSAAGLGGYGGTCGMTLQQILQQYSSSGFGRTSSSRRGSMDTPRGGVNRDSTFTQASDASESWLGDN